MRSPLKLYQGPLPIRVFASTVLVLRNACQVLPPAPASFASDWQSASAPERPPKLPPFGFELVTKKLMFAAGFCATAVYVPSARTATPAAAMAFLSIIVQCSCGGEFGATTAAPSGFPQSGA